VCSFSGDEREEESVFVEDQGEAMMSQIIMVIVKRKWITMTRKVNKTYFIIM